MGPKLKERCDFMKWKLSCFGSDGKLIFEQSYQHFDSVFYDAEELSLDFPGCFFVIKDLTSPDAVRN